MNNRIIFHIDVNSAYLSWEAAYRLQHGASLDLRSIPSVVGGDISKRHGIILAKSIPAKKYGIKTGEPLLTALQKCPSLEVIPPNYSLYLQCSMGMVDILKDYSPKIEQYSIDECFMDYTHMNKLFGSPAEAANHLRARIKKELGFTVNIGISSNKLLAKMASDFKKPDRVHTLFTHEIQEKMWPLTVSDLFMVGRATTTKLHHLGIHTIGELANTSLDLLHAHFKSHGTLIYHYANGKDHSQVKPTLPKAKGIGNSTTISFDVEDGSTAKLILLSLTETVAMRLREAKMMTRLISVSIKSSEFVSYSHQKVLAEPTDITKDIYDTICELFDEAWKHEKIRHLGVRVSSLSSNTNLQLSLFHYKRQKKYTALDRSIDKIRKKYGKKSIIRASFIHSGLKPLNGGVPEENYPMMSSIL